MTFSLIGHKGCGKTTVAAAYAKKHNIAWIDTDVQLLEKIGKKKESIVKLYQRIGKQDFQNQEQKLIKELIINEDTVISTGGGVPLREDNITYLQQFGRLIYLHVNDEVLYQRWQSLGQALLDLEDMLAWREYYDSRHIVYQKAADIVIDVSVK